MKKKKRNVVTRTPEQAKRWLRDQGWTVRTFCKKYRLDVAATYDVLNRRSSGQWGKASAARRALKIALERTEHRDGVTPTQPAREGGAFSAGEE